MRKVCDGERNGSRPKPHHPPIRNAGLCVSFQQLKPILEPVHVTSGGELLIQEYRRRGQTAQTEWGSLPFIPEPEAHASGPKRQRYCPNLQNQMKSSSPRRLRRLTEKNYKKRKGAPRGQNQT